MGEIFPSWLRKPMLKGARSFNLDAYLLALEGWRRGLTLKWYYDMPEDKNMKLIGFNTIGKIFSLSDGENTHFFYRSRGDKVSNKAVTIAGDKQITKDYLMKKGITTPKGKSFDNDSSASDIYEYINVLGTPAVIKPSKGSLGNGVFTDVNTMDDVIYAVNYIRENLGYEEILVEKFIHGVDVRVYVVNGSVVAATKREASNVIGDGSSTVAELIEDKNELRKKNPHLSTRLLKVDSDVKKFLEKNGYSLDSIPEYGHKVFINDKANISAGGDSVNILSELPKHAADLAIKTIESIEGLKHAGVDLIVNEYDSTVLEINSTAGIALHILPSKGEPTNIEKPIIDYYFPHTKGKKINELVYFNYLNIAELLRSKAINMVEVSNTINEPLIAKRFIVKGKVQGVGYRKWVRRQANKLDLNGYVKNLNNGNVVVIAASQKIDTLKELKSLLYEGPNKSNVTTINEYDWEKQINIGFEIRK